MPYSPDHVQDTRALMEHAVSLQKYSPPIDARSAVQPEHVEPVISYLKQQPEPIQQEMAKRAEGLSRGDTKLVPDPASQSISKSRVMQYLHYPKQYQANQGYLQSNPVTPAMQHGTDLHAKIESFAADPSKFGFVPKPSLRKVANVVVGGGDAQVTRYTTNDPDRENRHMSNVQSLFNDFEPVSMEKYTKVKTTGQALGLEEHMDASGQPVPYNLSGRYDTVLVGRPNTAYAGKKIMVDLKTTRIDERSPASSMLDKALTHLTEEAFYNFLYPMAKEGTDEYGVFYTDSGHLILFGKDSLKQRLNQAVLPAIQQIHKDQSKYRPLMDMLTMSVK